MRTWFRRIRMHSICRTFTRTDEPLPVSKPKTGGAGNGHIAEANVRFRRALGIGMRVIMDQLSETWIVLVGAFCSNFPRHVLDL